jgi:hypothetical protein
VKTIVIIGVVITSYSTFVQTIILMQLTVLVPIRVKVKKLRKRREMVNVRWITFGRPSHKGTKDRLLFKALSSREK